MKSKTEEMSFRLKWKVSYDSPAMKKAAIREIERGTPSQLMHFGKDGSFSIRVRQNAKRIGADGGIAKSPAKTAAVRENGKKGGRPRKPVNAASAAPCTVRPSAGHEMPTPNNRIDVTGK